MNIIDRLADYFDRKGFGFGERYTRCLIGFLYAWSVIGFIAGFMLGMTVGVK